MHKLALALGFCLMIAVPAHAQAQSQAPAPAQAQSSPASAQVEILHPWARATLAGTRTGAIYLTLVNKGAADNALTGVATPVAASAKLHQDVVTNGMMEMKPVPTLTLPPGGSVAIAPGKYHIMLMGLKQPLKAGSRFPLTLDFARGGAETVSVAVESLGAGGGDAGMSGMSMGGGMDKMGK